MVVTDPSEYEEFLETVARSRVGRDPSSPRHVAKSVILKPYPVEMDGGYPISFSGDPYISERITPSAVVLGSSEESEGGSPRTPGCEEQSSDHPGEHYPIPTDSLLTSAWEIFEEDLRELIENNEEYQVDDE